MLGALCVPHYLLCHMPGVLSPMPPSSHNLIVNYPPLPMPVVLCVLHSSFPLTMVFHSCPHFPFPPMRGILSPISLVTNPVLAYPCLQGHTLHCVSKLSCTLSGSLRPSISAPQPSHSLPSPFISGICVNTQIVKFVELVIC